jgi:GT2 family glycosyltransferase
MCVSIITVNYNTGSKTIRLLESLKKFVNLPYEIIVVDNASQAIDYKNLQDYCNQHENIRLIKNKFNSGFGAGNMLGCNYASHPYLAFINNDVVMLEDTLTVLKQFLDQHEKVAAVSPQQLNESGGLVKSFDYFHGLRKTLLGRWSVELFKNKSLRRSNKIFDRPIEVDFIQGSFIQGSFIHGSGIE